MRARGGLLLSYEEDIFGDPGKAYRKVADFAGLEPLEVLRAATHDAARALGRSDLGQLKPGAVADLLVLSKDPAKDAKHLRNITHVMRLGILCEREELSQ